MVLYGSCVLVDLKFFYENFEKCFKEMKVKIVFFKKVSIGEKKRFVVCFFLIFILDQLFCNVEND